MASSGTNILQPFEIENFIDKLECINIEEMLTSRWVCCAGHLVQLGTQAALEAARGGHEHVQHTLTLNHKELEVVWHLLMGEAWRVHLLPVLLKQCRETPPASSLPFMMVLQMEVAAMGLLESLSFHEESASTMEGLILDVIDYSVRQMIRLATHAHTQPNCPLYGPQEASNLPLVSSAANDMEKQSCKGNVRGSGESIDCEGSKGLGNLKDENEDFCREVRREERRVGLVLGCRAIAVLHLLARCRQKLPLCATTRLMNTHDVPQLLATLLQTLPWRTQQMGAEYVFENGEWRQSEASDPALSCTECQIWATLQILLLDYDSFSIYEVSSGRRTALLKLRGRLNAAALSQVPALEPLERWLAALALTAPQHARPPPLITTLSQLSDGVAGMWVGRWEELTQVMAPKFLKPTHDSLHTLASNMAAAWDLDALDELLPTPPKCASCGSPAGRKCSRCRNQWYCRRECQVQHWPQHKILCDLISKTTTIKHKESQSKLSSLQ